jgi:hypothetical protein
MAMKMYLGTRAIKAVPMTRAEYNIYRGWELQENEKTMGEDQGFLVEALNSGHVSWLIKEEFEAIYEPVDGMSFGLAIEAAKLGRKIARAGWNGKGMWVVYMSGMSLPPYSTQGTERKVNDRTAKLIGEDTPLETLPYFAMWTINSDGRRAWLPGWLASQSDMLAVDWRIVE